MDARRVGRDVDQPGRAKLAQARLLALDDTLVLGEGGADLLEQLLGRRRLVLAIAVGGRPEIEAARLGLGRQAVEDAQREPALAPALVVRAGAGIERAGILDDAARRDE